MQLDYLKKLSEKTYFIPIILYYSIIETCNITMKKKSLSFMFVFAFILFVLTSAKATIYTVTTTTFGGAGSIQQAVNNANGNVGKDTIRFLIPGATPFTITMTSGLVLTDAVLIDGTSQPGYNPAAPSPVIELVNSPSSVFNVNVGASDIRSLGINNSQPGQQGIVYLTSNNKLTGCYIGLGLDGNTNKGNGSHGIVINPGSNGNIIGGTTLAERNIISGNNNGHGIIATNSSNNYIIGNYIGTNSLGTVAVPNVFMGIQIGNSSNNNTIGGASLDSSNLISGNKQCGIQISNGNYNRILGNTIGLQSDKSSALGNLSHGIDIVNCNYTQIGGIGAVSGNIISSNIGLGIQLTGSKFTSIKSNIIGTSQNTQIARGNLANGIQLFSNCPQTIIGGDHLTEGNIISASGGAGINFQNTGSNKTIIKGNYIGTDNTGTLALGNGAIGIILKSDSCIIGSTVPGEGNVIVDSRGIANIGGVIDTTGCGILIANANANVVKGNLIGVGADGTTPLPNIWDGINISVEIAGDSASNNIIQFNVIAYNLNNGISVGRSVIPTNVYPKERYNNLRFNSIFCNKKLGIYLELNKPTDWGNNGQVAPTINNALSTSSKIVGIANATLVNDSIDIYEMVDCPNCDLNPQGKTYIATVVPDAAGNWSYDHGSPITGTFIATATDAQKNTSQFSICFTPCKALATVSPATFTVQLEMNSAVPVTLTSSSTFSNINPIPGKIFWSLNTPDTTGAALFSTANSVNFNFSTTGAAGDHGPGLYTIYLIAKQTGCMDTVEAKLNIFFIPNVVTPNGDNHNDQWSVGNAPGQFDAKIYNRWGDLVYSKSDYTNEWNGDGLSDGVYYYLLEDKTQSKKSFKGWVQIMK